MNGQHKFDARTTSSSTSGKKAPAPASDLQSLSCRGVLELFVFLLISTIFFEFRHTDLLAPLGENIRLILGCPPPPLLTTLALAGYTLSALVLILHRTSHASRPQLRWIHLGYRSCFYFFYMVSNTLEANFMPVLVSGLLLFTLEHLNIWSYAMQTTTNQERIAL
ncbi:MAG: hypothetical protein IH614_18505 [Desulfuromonadales bacterium]|nr:hypothetical protein [Desulfuromonadales bacterium]